MANAPIKWLPAVPIPRAFDVKERIMQLEGYLEPTNPLYQPEPQHKNIRAAIRFYQEGKLDGKQEVFIKNGEIVDEAKMFDGSSVWIWSKVRSTNSFCRTR